MRPGFPVRPRSACGAARASALEEVHATLHELPYTAEAVAEFLGWAGHRDPGGMLIYYLIMPAARRISLFMSGLVGPWLRMP
jgi:hypothetical protein